MASSVSTHQHFTPSILSSKSPFSNNRKLSSSLFTSTLDLSSIPTLSRQFAHIQTLTIPSNPRPFYVVAWRLPNPAERLKKVVGVVKLALETGKAAPAPPVGPALGSKGVNIMAFCKDYNARTAGKLGDSKLKSDIRLHETF